MLKNGEWWKRLAAPVAAKMGISVDEFIKRMYQNRSTGDWEEFGDSARKLKWVDQIVDTIREDLYDKNPDAPSALNDASAPGYVNHEPVLPERVDANGNRYVLLPRLSPADCTICRTRTITTGLLRDRCLSASNISLRPAFVFNGRGAVER